MEYLINGACKSVLGKVRKNNEDNFCFNLENLNEENNGSEILTSEFTNKENKVFGIFDGMGGEEKGERASYIASKILAEYSKEHIGEEINWNEFVQLANERICEEMYGKDRMGTTMVGIQFCKNYFNISNLGDSRIYILKDDNIEQISVDHNEARLQEKLNINTGSKARLTQYLGIKKEEMIIQPYIMQFQYENINKIMLCSDGITDMLSDEDIKEILNGKFNPKEIVEILIDKAMENGGIDNTTVMVFDLLKKAQNEEIMKDKKDFENEKIDKFSTVIEKIKNALKM